MTRPVQVVPAILSHEPATLDKLVRQAATFTSYIQVDIMDGQFVPSKSIGWEDIARIRPQLNWEAHLMVLRPEEQVSGFQRAGARKIIFHYEATPEPQKIITAVRKLRLKVGLALKPETPVSVVLPLAGQID
ncbi:MAG: ribulose-phosphate 3-epimerase, partial [Chloroflexota bacterium]